MDCGGPTDPDAPAVAWSLDGPSPLAVTIQTATGSAFTYAVRLSYRVEQTEGTWRELVPSGAEGSTLDLALSLDPMLAARAGALPIELDLRLEVMDTDGNLLDTMVGEPLIVWVGPMGEVADAWLASEVIEQGGLDPLTGDLGPTIDFLGPDGSPLLLTAIMDGEE